MNAVPLCQRQLGHAVFRIPQRWPCRISTTASAVHRSYSTGGLDIVGVTEREVDAARAYCTRLLQQHDAPSYTLRAFIPASAQDAYLALRALNVDVARIADATSNPTVGAMRMQFWRDAITRALAFSPPKEPVAILLSTAAAALTSRTGGTSRMSKNWLFRIVNTREQHLHNPPFRDLAALETYAENTYATLLYLTLSTVPLTSVTADHIASHIGKAQGITAVLRGLPFLAFPAPPATHSPQNALGGALPGTGRQGFVPLPLDIMAEFGVREENVFREGGSAPGLRDAVFAVATRANDHLITAREMLKNVQDGTDVGHEFEHMDEEHGGVVAAGGTKSTREVDRLGRQNEEVNAGFGVLMPAISTQMWLDRLQAADFDVFNQSLRKSEWKLPWRAYWAHRGGRL